MDITPNASLRISLTLSASSSRAMASSKSTIYFGYGSNLWLDQMRRRCPHSEYLGIARLKHYRWIIYERGYANIVHEKKEKKGSEGAGGEEEAVAKHDYTHEVWGLVYRLQPSDETKLDRNEGVPFAYQKEDIECEFWPAGKEKRDDGDDRHPKKVKMLVYINHDMTTPSDPMPEYIIRMNHGIHDAIKEGVPAEYMRQVLRKYIPEPKEENRDPAVVAMARKQAEKFEDE